MDRVWSHYGSSPDVYRADNFSMVVADDLVPNKHQVINNHHADLTVIWLLAKKLTVIRHANIGILNIIFSN